MDNNFDDTFLSEEESEALKKLDELIELIDSCIEHTDGEKVTMLDVLKFNQLRFAYISLLYLTRDTDVKVSYELNEPFHSMGSVSVEGRVLRFKDPERFARVAEFADNTDVYPLLEDKVHMDFTFYGLTRKIK